MNNEQGKSRFAATKPLMPEQYKNNLIKAKTEEIEGASGTAASTSVSVSGNPNLTNGESPPPKEVPDMSSATFVTVVSDVCWPYAYMQSKARPMKARPSKSSCLIEAAFVTVCPFSGDFVRCLCVAFSFLVMHINVVFCALKGGDTLTLSLNKNKNKSEASTSATTTTPAPLTSPSSASKLVNLTKDDSEQQQPTSISVTHFSPTISGEGVERETLFSTTSKNPFLNGDLEASTTTTSSTGENGNPFLDNKFATIARSNPFSNSEASSTTDGGKNPFLDKTSTKKDEEKVDSSTVKIVSTL